MNEQEMNAALKERGYELITEGRELAVVDLRTRHLLGYFDAKGSVRIDCTSTASVYLGVQLALYRDLQILSIPAVAVGVEQARERLEQYRGAIRNLLAMLRDIRPESGLAMVK